MTFVFSSSSGRMTSLSLISSIELLKHCRAKRIIPCSLEEKSNFVEGDKSGLIFITSENDEEFEKQKAMVELAIKSCKVKTTS